MSTSMSMQSGMTFVFPGPRVTFGENVVCVHAWRCAAVPELGSAASTASICAGIEEHGRELVVDSERLDALAPELVELRRGSVVGKALHDRRRLHERVVASIGRRPVPGRAPHAEPAPRDSLLPHVDADIGRLRGSGVQAAVLGEHVVGADGVGFVIGHPPRAVRAPRLLVRDGEVDEIASGSEALARELPERHSHRRGEVQHVDGAASPDLGPDGPSTSSPPNGSRVHPSGLTGTTSVWPIKHRLGARRFAAFHACDERDPARGRLEAGHVEAGVAEERCGACRRCDARSPSSACRR